MTNDKIVCGCGRSFTRVGLSHHKCSLKPLCFKCNYCNREFTTEKRLITHLCESKRRYLQRDDRAVKLGYMAFERFYQRAMNRAATYDVFAASMLYAAFVRFGRHLINLGAVSAIGFIDFLLRNETPIDHWADLKLYTNYIKDLNKNEPALDAIDRNLRLMQQWSQESGEDWHEFFRKVAPPLAALWISTGRLSPWLLFTASSAHELLDRMTPEQTEMIEQTIDPAFWRIKLDRHKAQIETIRMMLAQQGI